MITYIYDVLFGYIMFLEYGSNRHKMATPENLEVDS